MTVEPSQQQRHSARVVEEHMAGAPNDPQLSSSVGRVGEFSCVCHRQLRRRWPRG